MKPGFIMLYWLLVAYFLCGIGSIFASFILNNLLGGSSAIFTHGKSKVSIKDEPEATKFLAQFTVPKRWFWHFYALGSVASLFSLYLNRTIPSLLLLLQCVRRLVESFTIMPGGKGSEMHLIHSLICMTYYPVLLVSFSFADSRSSIICVTLFLVASVLQSYSHYLLGRQRRASSKHSPINHPLFRFIHAPHYFAEFLI